MKFVELVYKRKGPMKIFIDAVEKYILNVSKKSLNHMKRNSNGY
jgi:hypothetical protein